IIPTGDAADGGGRDSFSADGVFVAAGNGSDGVFVAAGLKDLSKAETYIDHLSLRNMLTSCDYSSHSFSSSAPQIGKYSTRVFHLKPLILTFPLTDANPCASISAGKTSSFTSMLD
ncbi:hypothetical protein Tco_0911914, partial [Tanacetum coccineum]